jgi:hypothetical protein
MRKSISIVIVILLTSVFGIAKEAPKGMTEFNVTCPAGELCPLLELSFDSCKSSKKEQVCSIFVEIFKNLVDDYDCQRPFDNTPTKNYIVPAVWLCGSSELWDYVELLSNLEYPDAQDFFASSEFRSILDGALGQRFREQSRKTEKMLKRK